MKTLMITLGAATLTLPTMATPAMAHYDDHRYERYYDGPVWQGRGGRWHCKKSDGTTGLIVGAAGGALLGREIDGRGDKAVGTILGAAAGALLGRAVEREVINKRPRYCR